MNGYCCEKSSRREQLTEVRGQFAQFVGGVAVDGGIHRLEQFAPLLRGHAVKEGLHLPHLTGEHLHEFVELRGGSSPNMAPPLVHEAFEIGLQTSQLLPHHPVEVAQHLAGLGHLLRVHVLHLLPHLRGDGAEHLLAKLVHQLLKLPLGLGVDEVEILEFAQGACRALGQLVEAFAVPVGPLAEEVAQLAGLPGLLAAYAGELILNFTEAAVRASALGLEHIVEPLLEVAHDRVHVVPIESLTAA